MKRRARPKIKPSGWILLYSLAVGEGLGCAAWWFWPGAHWGVYLGGGFVIACLLLPELLKNFAYQSIVDRYKRES